MRRNTLSAITLLVVAPLLSVFSSEVSARESSGKVPYSVGGFYQSAVGNRKVYGFNQGWRFYKGDVTNEAAAQVAFDDRQWEIVNVPHALEILNRNASGGADYQGVVWYRKHFTLPTQDKESRPYLHFEAVMGKCKIFINGKLARGHFGGYLPFSVDLSGLVNPGQNVVAVCADNSNDETYPPGKPQEQLDFCYFGGIYRDVWLTTMSRVHVSNANDVDVEAGGGVFVHYRDLSKKQATVNVQTHVLNHYPESRAFTLETLVIDKEEKIIAKTSPQRFTVGGVSNQTLTASLTVENPRLWTPETPYLYWVEVRIKDDRQEVVDAVRVRTGMRTIQMDAERGFVLNGKVYLYKLMGANRHQDYGYIGNAMTKNLHARDVRLFRELGMRSIRSAHYPQDPAFMDAADELGMFVIVATPGWQFWNEKDPVFAQRVYQDIRNMVRRDRNHPSVLMWECILNEARYPEDFAKEAYRVCHAEYPYPGCYAACDEDRPGKDFFDVLYAQQVIPGKVTFTREYSSNVDDFTAHNSDDRLARMYGEKAMMVQALHQLDNSYLGYTRSDYAKLAGLGRSFIGGTLWPGFEYNRSYHMKPQYGGVMDIFRYPKTSYYAMKSQRDPGIVLDGIDSGPTIYIANELTTFSDSDITVFSNCDSVRLWVNGQVVGEQKTQREGSRLKHDLVTFTNAFVFMRDWKPLAREKMPKKIKVEAQGLINGRVVARHVRNPAFLRHSINVWSDYGNQPIYADGSTIVPVFARLVDRFGTHVVLDDQALELEIEGPGEIVEGDAAAEANPVRQEFGIAPILIRVGSEPGKIALHVRNSVKRRAMPKEGALTIETIAPPWREIADEKRMPSKKRPASTAGLVVKPLGEEHLKAIEEVSKQQQEFDPSLHR